MTTERLVAVLDVGKTNAKVVLHDLATGRDVAVRTAPNTVVAGPPYPHEDTEAVWAFAAAGFREISAGRTIEAVSVTTHGAAAALLGESGLALPVLDYEHAGIEETAAAYEAVRPGFAETSSPRLPVGLNLGAQIFWQRETFPKDFSAVRAIVTYPQYWGYRLTGQLATDVTSLGCHTDLWRPAEGRTSTLVDRLGLADLLAPVRRPFDVLGSLSATAAAETGLVEGLPVLVGIHDSNASLLPHLLAWEAPFTVVSTGTWTVLFAVGAKAEALDSTRDTLANTDAFGRPVPSARFMGGREFETLTGGQAAVPTAVEIRRVIGEKVMAFPSFAGRSGPYPTGVGRWSVDPDRLSAGERTAAASLYAALMTATSMALIGADGATVVEGPFARNALILKALGALTRRPVLASAGATGTSAGAALLALGPEGTPPKSPETTPVEPLEDASGLADYANSWRIEADRSVPIRTE